MPQVDVTVAYNHLMPRRSPRPEWRRWWLRWIRLTGPFPSVIQSSGRCGEQPELAEGASLLITMGCGDKCPYFAACAETTASNAILRDCLQSKYGLPR
jgi:hypothetical protein